MNSIDENHKKVLSHRFKRQSVKCINMINECIKKTEELVDKCGNYVTYL